MYESENKYLEGIRECVMAPDLYKNGQNEAHKKLCIYLGICIGVQKISLYPEIQDKAQLLKDLITASIR